ncbi:MAG: DUF389 domain-containing protein, partial [Phycisphaerae bacterium]|nr:DUF389 domain-containing protein [Phycisphaerae bacterium]NIP51619.1 DUF389 domain-containing protein [Phycisphaerae bacterium]NIS50780.1 DUF389 domain-containing protein [Phycisphaerae bacterium]NIX27597.1 DUF389 domain-containing protein [Phycisphaerae bacterium]
RKLTGGWAPYVEDAVPGSDLTQQMHQVSIPSFAFFFMLALAAVIATFGLIANNSAPAIIGAMIIAPLMAPIMSLSYGLVVFERRLITRSILTVICGVILVMVLAYLTTLLFGLRITGSEILNRTSPTLIDLGVAMAAGGAAAFAHTRRSIINSIAGVAIAVALVPPLAVSGIGLALGHKAVGEAGLSLSKFGLYSGGTDIAIGAFLLFATNFVGIVAVAILVFLSQRYGEWKKALIGLVVFIGIAALLFHPLEVSLHKLYVKHRVVRLATKLSSTRPDIVSGKVKLESTSVTFEDGLLHVYVEGFLPKDRLEDKRDKQDVQKRVDQFREYLMDE